MSEAGRIIGRGRSGIVSTTEDPDIVEKRFESAGLEKVIQTIFFGAPNYDTDEDAINTAYYRRLVLSDMVEFWFDGKLRVAKPKYVKYDEEKAVFKLGMEFVKGRAPKLLSPFQHDRSELTDLLETTEKLQTHLDEAGCVGTEWQAGKGNPVALNNYILVLKEEVKVALRQTEQAAALNNPPPEEGTPADYKWAMIDCESGAPPYVPISLKGFFYYIKQSMNIGKLLFDDVDIQRLREYLPKEETAMIRKLGNGRYDILLDNINQLERYQNRWKSKTRVQRGISYQLKKGRLSQKWANFYSNHHLIWYSRETARLTTSGLWKAYNKLVGDLPWWLWKRITQVNPIKLALSQKYRVEIGKDYVRKRIVKWGEKERLDEKQASLLEKQLESNELMDYIGDLGAHAVIWPIGKGLDAITIPYLYITGHPYLASFLVFWGTTPFLRVGYTGVRFAQSYINGKEKPWWAFIGIFPQFGNFAYPIQMSISAEEGNQELPMFLILEGFTKVGERLPILGGQDTLTERKFNHLGYRIGRYFGRKE